MKKVLAFIIITAALITGSIYTVSTYNKSNSENSTTAKINSEIKSNTSDKLETDSTQKPILSLNNNGAPKKAIDFKLKDLDGKEISLSDYRGKKVFLNFWATWCPPCRAEMPDIEKLYQETKDSDLVILSVDIGEDKETVKSFKDKYKYNFKMLLDADQEIASAYKISSIPSSYFINKDGNIVATHIGAMNLEQMKSYISRLDK